MADIDSRNARLATYTQTVEDIKTSIKNIANAKNIGIVEGTDTPLTVLTKINNGTIATPSGTINITSNGTVDVTNYASANVSVVNTDMRAFVEGSLTTFKASDYGITKIVNAPNSGTTTMDLTGVTEIGNSNGSYCILSWDLTSLTLGATTLKLYDYAINSCINVSSFTFDKNTNVTQLGEQTFDSFGGSRSGTGRFTFDFRNSTFTAVPTYCFGAMNGAAMKYNDIYFPSTLSSIDTYAFGSMSNSNLFFKNVPSLANANARGATSTKYFFPYHQAKSAKSATNWSNTNIVSKIYGWAEENTFSNGDTLPATDTGGNALTWYSNPAMTSTYQVTTVSDATQIYYCKVA